MMQKVIKHNWDMQLNFRQSQDKASLPEPTDRHYCLEQKLNSVLRSKTQCRHIAVDGQDAIKQNTCKLHYISIFNVA